MRAVPVAASNPNSRPALELRGITKTFGGCVANDGITVSVAPGTIHGLVGENGAGKSTAMKIAYGMIRPDTGEIRLDGQLRRFRSPSDAIRCGVGMVHQHFLLAAPHSALDNILLGAEPTRFGFIERSKARAKLLTLARQHGLAADLERPVQELPLGAQQKVEILKLLYRNANILILDEPTAVLTPQQTTALFDNLRSLRASGKTVILITHKLREVKEITDTITVLRRGKVVAERKTAETSRQELADLMVGRSVNLSLNVNPSRQQGEVALELKRVSLTASLRRHSLRDISLSVRSGEIVGIAGVEGNGQSELVNAILHPRDPACHTSGEVWLFGQNATDSPAQRIRSLGLALVPENRHAEGLLLDRPLWENVLLGSQREARFNTGPLLRRNALRAATAAALEKFDVRPRAPNAVARALSGGNQQKLIFARELSRSPKLLIAAQPTRGVDVGAIEFIHRQIIAARDYGAAVLLLSSDLDEVRALADRILVMFEGRIAAEYARNEASESELGLKMGGG